mgnify:CR=1 FL=1|tara:strand:+ start:172 stop:357 length:186 start_codon:yes stop_codon:yes gene_type:complete
MRFIKVLGVIILALLLITLVAAIGWALQIDPEMWLFPAFMTGFCIGLFSLKFIIDIIEGDL